MFTALSINSTAARRQVIHGTAVECGILSFQRVTDEYPVYSDLMRLCSLGEQDFILLDLEDLQEAMRVLVEIEARYPNALVIGVGGRTAEQQTLARHGVAQCLPYPFDPEELIRTLGSAIRSRHSEPLKNLAVFIPAKAGCGASTLTLCTATAMAAYVKKQVLCIDADLRSGVLGFMMDVAPRGAIQDALIQAFEFDTFQWSSWLTQAHGVDFLLSSGANPRAIPEWTHYFALLRFVQQRYEMILVDLPELVNSATEELVRRASSVFVVSTQELVALKLAERRCTELKSWGVPDERVHLLVNRFQHDDLAASDIESFAKRPVAATFPNEYLRLRNALVKGAFPLAMDDPLGRAAAHFAYKLAGMEMPDTSEESTSRFTGMLRSLVSRKS